MSASLDSVSTGNDSNPTFHNGGFENNERDTIQRSIIHKSKSADDVMRRPSIAKSTTSSKNSKSFGRRLSQYSALKYIQKFTEQQKSQLDKFSSVSYLPSHSDTYIQWLTQFTQRLEWDRWFLLFVISILIGLLAAFIKQCLQLLNNIRWDRAKDYAEENDIVMTWVWNSSIGVLYVLISSFLVVFVHPPAVGSGVPEVISYLNGITVHKVLSLKNLIVKFISVAFAASSGLPAAIQGPIIAFGAIIGNGVGQFKSQTLGLHPNWFVRFRNAEDRRTFTTAGVAAGVAAAFNAPIGGLLFAMEDLTSFWNKTLSWQTFFCCGIAAMVANVINTSFSAFDYRGGPFGLFSLSVTEPIQIHILILVPALILGVTGGVLGALFTRSNAWIVRQRKVLLAKISNTKCQGLVRMLETTVLVLIMSCTTTLLPLAFDCTIDEKYPNDTAQLRECGFAQGFPREPYNCDVNVTDELVAYSEVATLMQGAGTTFLEKLTTRGTHRWLGYDTLLSILPIWFFMTIWTCGSAIAGGIFVPNLVSGALYGRALGLGLLDLWEYFNPDYIWDTPVGDKMWAWLDPGVIAVIGAGSLMGGVTRLNLASTVIIVEMSHDLDLTVPVLITIWLAKIVADIFSKPLYKYQLDGKALPYLDQDPTVILDGEVVNLERYTSRDVMHSPVLTLKTTESLHVLARVLLHTSHSGFPVVQCHGSMRQEFVVGLITRTELYVLLCSDKVYEEHRAGTVIHPDIEYEQISVDYLPNHDASQERVRTYLKFSVYHNIFLNMESYMNRSVVKVDQNLSLYRSYSMFRSLGLRHLLVTDKNNGVVGIITRKDLLAFNIEQKLKAVDFTEDDVTQNGGQEVVFARSVSLNALDMKQNSILEENEHEDYTDVINSGFQDDSYTRF